MTKEKWLTPEIVEVLNKAADPERTKDILKFAVQEMDRLQIHPTNLQLTVLTNHLGEMIRRAQTGERLAPVDKTVFASVSAPALQIARDIACRIGGLDDSEAYILSVHFENAKANK
ncbi:MAG: hypothetical protein LKI94_00780 [Sporolactobacillus sp.]|nr:hypothetical protein [Sporolactobacillus sp.]MCI1880709.1 hypothetical protein [Sporolactobacillus sp.]